MPEPFPSRRRTAARSGMALGGVLVGTMLCGCALTWDDAQGQRHFLGIGYMVVPQPKTEAGATLHGLDMAGIGISATQQRTGLMLGYVSERFLTLGAEAAVETPCLTCPAQDLILRPAKLPPTPPQIRSAR